MKFIHLFSLFLFVQNMAFSCVTQNLAHADEQEIPAEARNIDLSFLLNTKTPTDYRDFDNFQYVFTQKEVSTKIIKYLQKEPGLIDFYSVTDKALNIFASKTDKALGKPEFILYFNTNNIIKTKKYHEKQNQIDQKYPLRGYSIALDPGHLGGKMSHIEDRYIDMEPVPEIQDRKNIQFDEGTLTFLTAKRLQKLLEAKGAKVFLSREKIGSGAYKMTFEEWMKHEFTSVVETAVKSIKNLHEREKVRKYWLNDATPVSIFRFFYNELDMKARAIKINAFKPDLTLIIHYNSDGVRNKITHQNIGTWENYNMVFVPGAFMNDDLSNIDSRYNFVRLIVTEQIEESIKIAQKLAYEFAENLHISLPPDHPIISAPYLENSSMKMADGVYSRNLEMTRTLQSPISYGESLYQDNFIECEKLAAKNIIIDGVRTSDRVEQVAQAYFKTVLYFKKSHHFKISYFDTDRIQPNK